MSIKKERLKATYDPERKDRFEFNEDKNHYHFPCNCCRFVDPKNENICLGCRYYWNIGE